MWRLQGSFSLELNRGPYRNKTWYVVNHLNVRNITKHFTNIFKLVNQLTLNNSINDKMGTNFLRLWYVLSSRVSNDVLRLGFFVTLVLYWASVTKRFFPVRHDFLPKTTSKRHVWYPKIFKTTWFPTSFKPLIFQGVGGKKVIFFNK